MTRWRSLIGSTSFAVVAFLAALLLFNWTYLSDTHLWSARRLFVFMFLAWGLIIALLVVISLCLPHSAASDKKPPQGGGRDV